MMKYFKNTLVLIVMLSYGAILKAQNEQNFETNPIILEKLDKWQDLKFGFMMHWGMYAQWSTVESWSICNEEWIDHRNGMPYDEYKTKYQALNKTFNPTKFNPEYWAKLAAEAGMKYVVFTTKHHDGFCMFDSKETTYTITDPSCPFYNNEQADVTKAIVDAFRAKGFWTGLYFSKPDWHHSDYWAPEWTTYDRNVNYNPQMYPLRWQKFCDFTYNQIKELATNYGDIDILWLDGGWIRPEWSLNDEYRTWLGCKQWIQDVDIPKIAAMARENNPDLLIVDRTIHGKYENYQTPEQLVPDSVLPYPWETCMSMGHSWSYVDTDEYKSTNTLIHILIDVVAKGGNYLLNVGPDPYGELPPTAIERMKEIGEWMKINGEAIYGTRPIYPYTQNNLRFTQSKDKKVYVFCLLDEKIPLSKSIEFAFGDKLKTGNIKILGSKAKAKLLKSEKGYRIEISQSAINKKPCEHAVVFVLER